jgi:hypothetical protein
MILVIIRIDVASKAINDGRTVEAPPRGLAVVGFGELDVDELVDSVIEVVCDEVAGEELLLPVGAVTLVVSLEVEEVSVAVEFPEVVVGSDTVVVDEPDVVVDSDAVVVDEPDVVVDSDAVVVVVVGGGAVGLGVVGHGVGEVAALVEGLDEVVPVSVVVVAVDEAVAVSVVVVALVEVVSVSVLVVAVDEVVSVSVLVVAVDEVDTVSVVVVVLDVDGPTVVLIS